jgi:hypothetical protein
MHILALGSTTKGNATYHANPVRSCWIARFVDGYACYRRDCATMETMIEYMETDESTGINNLAHSWDIVAWWAVYAFLHMDQTPVPNEL